MREKWNKIHEAIFKDFDEDSIIGPSGIYLRLQVELLENRVTGWKTVPSSDPHGIQ